MVKRNNRISMPNEPSDRDKVIFCVLHFAVNVFLLLVCSSLSPRNAADDATAAAALSLMLL